MSNPVAQNDLALQKCLELYLYINIKHFSIKL